MKEIEGWVEAISPKPDKDSYGIMLDNDEWFNGKPRIPDGVEKGSKVVIEYEEVDGANGPFRLIENISVEEPNNPSKGGKGASSTSKQQDIDIGMCFKKAVDQTDRRQVEDEQAYKEMIIKLTKLHMEALEEVKNR